MRRQKEKSGIIAAGLMSCIFLVFGVEYVVRGARTHDWVYILLGGIAAGLALLAGTYTVIVLRRG